MLMSQHDARWSIIVHGGAREIPLDGRAKFDEGCYHAATAGASVLRQGGSALDAAETAVRILEDAPQFNAGRGSVRNAAGKIEMDAAIMDGRTLALGGVGAIRNVRHPISVARKLLEERPILLVGDGANKFASSIQAEAALPECDAHQSDPGGDTVGCVALDRYGHLSAAGSTGGLTGKMVGRVGDTPLPGCGLYADDEMGAAALSGEGESIARMMLAARSMWALEGAPPYVAAKETIECLARVGGEAGIILLNRDGRMGIAHNSPQFAVGLAASWIDQPKAATDAGQLKEWFE